MGTSLFDYIGRFFAHIGTAQREKAVALTCVELNELENIFALLLLGSFVGFPAPPTFLSVELLPFMEREMAVLHQRAGDASDMLAEMVGTLGIE
jgi:hypothetical protein